MPDPFLVRSRGIILRKIAEDLPPDDEFVTAKVLTRSDGRFATGNDPHRYNGIATVIVVIIALDDATPRVGPFPPVLEDAPLGDGRGYLLPIDGDSVLARMRRPRQHRLVIGDERRRRAVGCLTRHAILPDGHALALWLLLPDVLNVEVDLVVDGRSFHRHGREGSIR